MSLKTLVVSHGPSSAVAGAKQLRNLGRSLSSRLLVRRLLKSGKAISLELGSGSKKGSDVWTTLDIAPGCDMYCNLANGIPFPDSSIQNIYSSHFFEHLTFSQTQALLGECLRVMVPGARFSICVPNARLYLEAYVNNDLMLDEGFFAYKPAYNHTTRIDYANYVAYMDDGHKYMFDQENLIYILRRSGLKNAQLREFDPNLDRKERDFESIYAEGYK